MNKRSYLYEVDALRASPALRAKVASLPNRRRRRTRSFNWVGLVSALVLVVGLGLAAPAILRIFSTGGQLDPPPVVTQIPIPEGIIAEGIDVSPVILDAAKEYVQERYDYQSKHNRAPVLVDGEFQEGPTAVFDNWRIEGLTAAYERKELGDYTVAVYQLDYRLHTTTPERVVLAGAAEVDEEGWYLDTYPGCTYLVFLLDYSSPHYFATMLNDCSPGSALFDESILQDISAYLDALKGEESPLVEPTATPQEIQGVALDQLDYEALEAQMTAGDWAALQPYLPVLRSGGTFSMVWEDDHTGEKMGPEEMTIDEFRLQRFGFDNPDEKLDLEKLTLLDLVGDGTQDLILCFYNYGGNYLILHREGEKIYATERGYRSFMQLQTDGAFVGSSGADYHSYYRLAFQNGRFAEELLGEKINTYCEIGGIEVSEEYFIRWRESTMGNDMWWYYPAEKMAVEGVRAFLEDYPISTYGPSEYSDFGLLTCAPVTDYQDGEFPKALVYHVVLQHGIMDRYFLFDQEHRFLGTRSTPEFTLTIDGKAYPLGVGTRSILGTPTGTHTEEGSDGLYYYSEWFAPEARNGVGYNYWPDTGEYRLSGINTIREDVYTYRGIHVGSTVAEVLAAYPECDTRFGDQTHSLTYSYSGLNLEFTFQNDPAANRETILARKIENINLSAAFW